MNSNNIYSILGKLASLTPKEEPKSDVPSLKEYAEVPARGSVLEGVDAVEARLKKQFMSEDPQEAYESETCNECGMFEAECSCVHEASKPDFLDLDNDGDTDEPMKNAAKTHKTDKGEVTHKDGVTKHRRTDLPGYSSDDDEESEEERSKASKRGRPRKATTKKPRPTGEKKGRGRPKKSDSGEKTSSDKLPFSSKNVAGHDPFGRVKSTGHKKASGEKVKGRASSDKAPKGSPEYVGEKAVSQAQQKFMGMVHATQKGAKPASPEVAKVARSMGKRDARDFATTKHKGLPQHVRESILESVNFKRMMDETSMGLEEMLDCLNNDMKEYKLTGNLSERLRDFMHLHHHAKKQMEEAGIPGNLPPNQVPGKQALLKTPATPMQRIGGAIKDTLGGIKDFVTGKPEDPNRPTYEEDLELEEELNELARLAGLSTEGNAFTGKLNDTPKGGKFELDGKEFTDISNLDEADVDVQTPDSEPVNAPKKKYFSMKNSTLVPGEGDSGEKNMYGGPGDNPMTQPPNRPAKPVKSISAMEARLSAEYESIKKVK